MEKAALRRGRLLVPKRFEIALVIGRCGGFLLRRGTNPRIRRGGGGGLGGHRRSGIHVGRAGWKENGSGEAGDGSDGDGLHGWCEVDCSTDG